MTPLFLCAQAAIYRENNAPKGENQRIYAHSHHPTFRRSFEMGVNEQDFDAVRRLRARCNPALTMYRRRRLATRAIEAAVQCAALAEERRCSIGVTTRALLYASGLHVCILEDGRAAARANVGQEAVRRPLPRIHLGPRPRVSLAVLLLRAAAAKRWRASTPRTSARRAAASYCRGCLT